MQLVTPHCLSFRHRSLVHCTMVVHHSTTHGNTLLSFCCITSDMTQARGVTPPIEMPALNKPILNSILDIETLYGKLFLILLTCYFGAFSTHPLTHNCLHFRKFYEQYGTGPRPFELSKSNFVSTCQRYVFCLLVKKKTFLV